MPKTLEKLRLSSNKHKPKIKPELIKTNSNLPPNLQAYKKTNFYLVVVLYTKNELRRFSNIR